MSCLAFGGVFYLLLRILTIVSYIAEMLPKVDLATRQALETTAVARAAEKRKKRQTIEVGQYELKRIYKGPRDDPVRTEAGFASATSLGVVPLGIPLVGVARESTSRPVRPEATSSHSSEPIRERIRPSLLLGNVMRF